MSQRILITPDEVRSVAAAFRQSSSQSLEIVNRLAGAINDMEPRWDGITKQKFYGEFIQWKTQMNHFVTLLSEIDAQLNTIADRFQAADEAR